MIYFHDNFLKQNVTNIFIAFMIQHIHKLRGQIQCDSPPKIYKFLQYHEGDSEHSGWAMWKSNRIQGNV